MLAKKHHPDANLGVEDIDEKVAEKSKELFK